MFYHPSATGGIWTLDYRIMSVLFYHYATTVSLNLVLQLCYESDLDVQQTEAGMLNKSSFLAAALVWPNL